MNVLGAGGRRVGVGAGELIALTILISVPWSQYWDARRNFSKEEPQNGTINQQPNCWNVGHA